MTQHYCDRCGELITDYKNVVWHAYDIYHVKCWHETIKVK